MKRVSLGRYGGFRSGLGEGLMWEVSGITYVLHDHIVGGDAISRDEEEGLFIDLEEVAHFSFGDLG